MVSKNLRYFLILVLLLAGLAALPAGAQDDGEPTFIQWDVQINNNGVLFYGIDTDGNRHLLLQVPFSQVEAATTADEATPDASTLAASARGYLIVNTSYLNVRSGPDAGYTIVGLVGGSDTLEVVGRNDDRSWWYVDVGGVRGWINGEHVLVRGDLSDVPVVETEGELIQPTLYIGFPGNPLYDELSAAGQVLCNLPGDAEHALVGRSAGGNWYQIETTCNDETVVGWIQADKGLVRNPAGVDIPITYR